MTKDQYKIIHDFFVATLNNETIDNKELIDFLALDKRPFAVSSITSDDPNTPNVNFKTAEINLIC